MAGLSRTLGPGNGGQQYNTYYHRLKWHNIQFQFYFIRFSQTTLKLWDTWKTPNHASNSFLNSHGFVNLMKRWSGDNIVILWFVMNGTRNWKMIACVRRCRAPHQMMCHKNSDNHVLSAQEIVQIKTNNTFELFSASRRQHNQDHPCLSDWQPTHGTEDIFSLVYLV